MTDPRRILFLDIDGPLTTFRSRTNDWETFDPEAVAAFRLLIGEGKPDLVVVHSTWRKLPDPEEAAARDFPYCWSHDWWREHCLSQRIPELGNLPTEDAPFRFSSDREDEIHMWLSANHVDGNRYVVLDDVDLRPCFAQRSDTLMLVCDEAVGLTLDQARAAVQHWSKP